MSCTYTHLAVRENLLVEPLEVVLVGASLLCSTHALHISALLLGLDSVT